MNKKIFSIVLGVFLIGVGIFFIAKFLTNKEQGPASLKITATPTSTIFLETQHLGKTPFEDKVKSGEYTLKLIPEGGTTSSWQTKIKITPGVLTYVNHEFGDQELTSAGEILSLEKISGKTVAEIAVLSTPDGAQVSLDGSNKGSTPLVVSNVEPGDRELTVSAPGFVKRGVKVKTTAGFKLVASFQLALSSVSATPSPSPTTTPGASPKTSPKPTASPKVTASPKLTASPSAELQRPYVKILDTPTGWLRVRMEPSTSATEAAKVNPGQTFPLLSQQSGWYKIRYEEKKEGWISGQYAEKFE